MAVAARPLTGRRYPAADAA